MSTPRSHYEERIAAVCRLIEENLDRDYSLEALSEAAGLSSFYFHRLFRGMTGESVAAYVRRLRLERAALRLSQGVGDILAVALDAGYGSHEAFTRAFTRRFGAPPSDFRSARREVVTRAAILFEEYEMDIEIRKVEPCWVAAVRHVGPYTGAAAAWQQLMKWGWSKLIFGKPQMFGLCYDDPEVTAEDQIRYDACMTVKAGTKVKPPIELRELPGGLFAVYEHVGPYDQLPQTYAAFGTHLATQPVDGKQWCFGDPPCREVYMNDPRKTKPEDLRTEIWFPVTDSPSATASCAADRAGR